MQILGTLRVAVVFSQICCSETVQVPDGQVHPVDYEDLTALENNTRATEKVLEVRFRKMENMTGSVKGAAVLQVSIKLS